MDCNPCCKNDLGCFPHNKPIDTGIEVDQDGMYELMFTGPNFNKFSKYMNVESGDNIIIPVGLLNEDFQYSLIITKPNGEVLSVNECSNFSFKTFINKVSCDDIPYL